jgi:hypothetical protein
MKKVIDGKIYNTDTAQRICTLPCNADGDSFKEHYTSLYRTKNGNYFLEGDGGAATMWARSVGNAKIWGSGLRQIDTAEAMQHACSANLSPEEMLAAGFELQYA